MRHSDILVIGAGMSGLMAAITAAKSGAKVTVVSEGAGVLSIGSGAIDFLGYINGTEILDDPFNHLNELSDDHPYNIIGAAKIKSSFNEIISIAKENGYFIDKSNIDSNMKAISIAGTFKPTYICSEFNNAAPLFNAKRILVVGVEYLKDNQPTLLVKELKHTKGFEDKEVNIEFLESPFGKTYRVLNCLDIARYVDTDEGRNWLFTEINKYAAGYDAVILPPICGIVNYISLYADLKARNVNVVETISIPPGVGGMRLRNVLVSAAKKYGVNFIENCNVNRAIIEGSKCKGVVALHSNIAGALETTYTADKFIIATGGLIGGGIYTSFDKVEESIFKIPLDYPNRVEEWSSKNVFDSHTFAKFGVKINNELKAIDNNGNVMYENVFFAGNTLGGYDFPSEKSGYGVAVASGYSAGIAAVTK